MQGLTLAPHTFIDLDVGTSLLGLNPERRHLAS